jgi:hypothetical protein
MRRFLPLFIALAGCGGGSSGDRVTERDSTITFRGASLTLHIVENPATPAADEPEWRLDDTPELDIVGEGVGTQALFRVGGAVRLADGRIIVADGGSTRLRVFDAAGREGPPIGRSGEGPGEFRDFSYLGHLPGDSIVVADFRLARISVFDAAGRLRREARWGATPESPRSSIIGVFADGSLLSRGFVAVETPPPRGLRRYPSTYYHLAADGTLADTLGDYAGSETYFVPIDRGFQVENGRFQKTSWFVAAGDRFHVAQSERYEVRVFRSDGTPLLSIRREHQARPIQSADIAAERLARLEPVIDDEQRVSMDRVLSEMPVPDIMPAFDRIAVDDELNVWVRDYRPAWETGSDTWTVFAPNGRRTAQLEMPRGLEPTHIGSDFLLGTRKDDDEAEHVLLYSIRKPE